MRLCILYKMHHHLGLQLKDLVQILTDLLGVLGEFLLKHHSLIKPLLLLSLMLSHLQSQL